jgi:hypothetical protein
MAEKQLTKACMRCGNWHTDAEKFLGQRLSCTEVKQFWSRVKKAHEEAYGHRPLISQEADGQWFCLICARLVLSIPQDMNSL